MNASLMSSKNMGWQTPPEFLELVRKVGHIRLDPCTTDTNPVGADVFYTPADDGLSKPWGADESGVVFVNPPYGRGIGEWVKRCAQAGGECLSVVALVPARTDTSWWHNYAISADLVCLWRGRLTFWEPNPDTGVAGPATRHNKRTGVPEKCAAPFPSAVLFWGLNTHLFADAFRDYGWIVEP